MQSRSRLSPIIFMPEGISNFTGIQTFTLRHQWHYTKFCIYFKVVGKAIINGVALRLLHRKKHAKPSSQIWPKSDFWQIVI